MRSQIRGRFDGVRDIDIEAYLCGELADAARIGIERASERDSELAQYLQERRAARELFGREHPLVRTSSAATRARSHRDGAVLFGAALAALVLVGIVTPRFTRDARQIARDTVRVKGHALPAELYVKRGLDVFRYRAGLALRAEDQVRISVECPRAGYLSVFGRDARGALTTYYDRLATAPGRYTVPDSLILDDTPGDEQWFIVHATQQLPAAHYLDEIRAGHPLTAPHALIALHKEAAR